jgi:hypothetical protein
MKTRVPVNPEPLAHGLNVTLVVVIKEFLARREVHAKEAWVCDRRRCHAEVHFFRAYIGFRV